MTEIALGVVMDRGRILIQPRRWDPLAGSIWELPGGKREADESLEEAVVREVAEEARLTVKAGDLLIALSHRYADRIVTLYVFLCAPVGEAEAGPDVEWVTPAEVRARGIPEANGAILDAVEWELAKRRAGPESRNWPGPYHRESSRLDDL